MTNDPVVWLAVAVAAAIASATITGFVVAYRLNRRIEGYTSIAKAVAAATRKRENLTKEIQSATAELGRGRDELRRVEDRTRDLVALESRAGDLRSQVESDSRRLEDLATQIDERATELRQGDETLHALQSQIDLYSRLDEFVEYGFFDEPEYLYETSERYGAEIKRVRDEQKQMIQQKIAVDTPGGSAFSIDGSSKSGKSVVDGQIKMMLRTFNIECDLLMGKVKPSNFQRTLERIEKISEALDKMAISLQCGISPDYVRLKYEECALVYEYRLRKQEEQEEQRLIREQMREEERARREYQAAVEAAEKEERLYRESLERARAELQDANEEARAELAAKIALLEEQLREAEAKETRAKSLAEQTRRGHVYVISNVGSFGEQVYKIGMTRRLDPMDRVKELGDASVPFQFDVHAVVYTDDAPAMETALHRQFHRRRVNAVNLRKEFFRVDLGEIQAAVEELAGPDVDFRTTILAEEYYETLRLQTGREHHETPAPDGAPAASAT